MKPAFNTRSFVRSRIRACLTAAAASFLLFSAQGARATIPVIDYTAIINLIRQYTEQIREFEAQVQHWQGEIQHWTDMKSLIGDITSQLSVASADMKKVDDDYMADEQCGTSGSLDDIVGNIFSSTLVALNPNGDLTKQQQQICRQMVAVHNRMYNETVDYVDGIMADTNELNELINKIGTEETSGAQSGIQSNAAALEAKTAQRSQVWSTRQSAYQAQLEYLEFRQQALARAALGGAPNILGQIVDTVALKAAFSN